MTLRDINKLNGAVEGIVVERKRRLKRYVSAKQYRKKLEGIAKRLDEARGNYTVSHIVIPPLRMDRVHRRPLSH